MLSALLVLCAVAEVSAEESAEEADEESAEEVDEEAVEEAIEEALEEALEELSESLSEEAVEGSVEEALADISRARRTFPIFGDLRLQFSPPDDIYPRHIANPYRTDFRFILMDYISSDIEGAGLLRYGVRIGGRTPLWRIHREGEPDSGLQFSIDLGFAAQFDLEDQLDNIGWDGVYGFLLAWSLPGGGAMRIGRMHDSSHVGDEFARYPARIEYTREEVVGGLAWRLFEGGRIYSEAGYAYQMGNPELMLPWRLVYGASYESPQILAGNRMALYLASDTSHFQEDQWTPNLTVQGGLVYPVPSLGRRYRIGGEYYQGRSQIGEYFESQERYMAFGFWFDL
jgi:hypothetical protein